MECPSIDKLGNAAALALGRELYRSEQAGGGFVLIHCARTIIDRAIRSQSIIAVQGEMEKLHRVAAACRAGLTAPAVPKALEKPEPKMNPDQDPIAEVTRHIPPPFGRS